MTAIRQRCRWGNAPFTGRRNGHGTDDGAAAGNGNGCTGFTRPVDGGRPVVSEAILGDRTRGGLHIIHHGNNHRRLRRRDVRRNGRSCWPRVACGVGGICGQTFAVGFWRRERDAEATVIIGFALTHRDVTFTNSHRTARFSGARDRCAVAGHDDVIRRERWRRIRCSGRSRQANVTAVIGCDNRQHFAVCLGRANWRAKGPVAIGCRFADDCAIRGFNGDGTARFCRPADALTIVGHHEVAGQGWRGGIGRGSGRWRALVTCSVRRHHGDQLAVGLRRGKRGNKVTVAVRGRTANDVSVAVGDHNAAVGLGGAGNLRASRIQRNDGLIRRCGVNDEINRLRQAALVACRIGFTHRNRVRAFCKR